MRRVLSCAFVSVALCGCGASAGVDLPPPSLSDTEADLGAPRPAPPPDLATRDTAPAGPLIKFAVFGDVRPPLYELTDLYPTDIITSIFKQAQNRDAQFAVGTGDYMFAVTQGAAAAQVQLLLTAEQQLAAPIYHAMGNHECLTIDDANCPNANETPNAQVFMSTLLPPQVTTPYYRIDKATAYGTAKFLFLAPNAWTDAQGTWFEQQLADPTAYTFVVRHEPIGTVDMPGVTTTEQAMSQHPLTIEFLGHVHEYSHVDSQHVISGNSGAELETSSDRFGFLMVEQLANGNMSVTEIDEATGVPSDTYQVTPSGVAAP
jgi:hypothetical protein